MTMYTILGIETMSPLPDEVFEAEAMSQAHSLPPPPNHQEAMRSEAKLSPLFYRGPTKESVKSAILPAAKDNNSGSYARVSQRARQATSDVPVTDAELYECEILTVADEPCGASQDRSVRPLEVKVGQLKRGSDKVC